MSFDPVPFNLVAGFGYWLLAFGGALAIALGVAFLTAFVAEGAGGPALISRGVSEVFGDLLSLSAGRIYALAQLTFREAIRRKALLVFVVFAILFMFAGWFMSSPDQRSDLLVKYHVSFVLRAIQWLMFPIMLLLSCWGLPEDIRVRSLHTVVTKPVRRVEVVIGRILGFCAIGTLVIGLMGLTGYIWLVRQVPASAKSELTCRRPLYGELYFIDRDGGRSEKGINTGDKWEFYSYIEGGTKARAIWTFRNMDESCFVNDDSGQPSLRLESQFQAFRSHKGNMNRTLLFQYTFVNPDTGLRARYDLIPVKEFVGNVEYIPRKFKSLEVSGSKADGQAFAANEKIDILTDLASKTGEMQVEVQCVDQGQYMGMARPHLFIRRQDASFTLGFSKAVFGIWLMMVLIVTMSVCASTFVKGPVATFLTSVLIVIGMTSRGFLDRVTSFQEQGAGTFEAIYRLLAHMNPQTPLPEGPAFQAMKAVDLVLNGMLWIAGKIIPNFDAYNMTTYVAQGFDVPWNSSILPGICITAAYLLPCILLGFVSLRLRELEAK